MSKKTLVDVERARMHGGSSKGKRAQRNVNSGPPESGEKRIAVFLNLGAELQCFIPCRGGKILAP